MIAEGQRKSILHRVVRRRFSSSIALSLLLVWQSAIAQVSPIAPHAKNANEHCAAQVRHASENRTNSGTALSVPPMTMPDCCQYGDCGFQCAHAPVVGGAERVLATLTVTSMPVVGSVEPRAEQRIVEFLRPPI